MNSLNIHPPFILNESQVQGAAGDVQAFGTAERLLGYVEEIDVQNREYFVYDGEGRLLRLRLQYHPAPPPRNCVERWLAAHLERRFGPGRISEIVLEPAEEQPAHAEELKSLLRQSLARQREPVLGMEEASLPELLARMPLRR